MATSNMCVYYINNDGYVTILTHRSCVNKTYWSVTDGTCQEISLQCPSLQENVLTKFTCSFETSTCLNTSVFFDFKTKDGTPIPLCQTPSSPCGQEHVGVMNCSCVSSNSSYSNYQLNFLGDKATYDQGNLTCAVNCRTGPVADSCQPIFGGFHQLNPNLYMYVS